MNYNISLYVPLRRDRNLTETFSSLYLRALKRGTIKKVLLRYNKIFQKIIEGYLRS